MKVRLQNRLNPYSGAWHCATSIVRYEGVRRGRQRQESWLAGCSSSVSKVRCCSWARPYYSASLPPPPAALLPQFRALYRGMSPQLVGGAVETGVNYAAYQVGSGWTQTLWVF